MAQLIKSLSELEIVVASLKERQEKIVFTNGCFDLLHQGHIYLLQEAKQLGTILILGINTDASVKKLKGANRPIDNLETRINKLSNLNLIDYIISFNEETPLKLIEIIKPNVLVKGGDYIKEQIVGFNLADETIVLSLFGDFSTTNQIKQSLNK